MSRLWKVGYLVSERRHVSLKDAEHLSKLCLGLSKECLCIGLHLSDLLSYVFGIFQQLHFVKKKCIQPLKLLLLLSDITT